MIAARRKATAIKILLVLGVLAATAAACERRVPGLIELQPKSRLPVIQAVEGANWTHAPAVPPAITRTGQARVIVEWTADEFLTALDAANGVRYAAWGFEGHTPGPILRVREGDLIEVHLTNSAKATHPHNIDFHFATGPGGGAPALSVAPGKTASVEVRALSPGIFMYHCATPDIPTHIANGMYGYVIVEPAERLPEADVEFYVVQSEFYTTATRGAPATLDVAKLDLEEPTYVVLNGAVGSLMGAKAPKVSVGDVVRIWYGNAGPQLVSSFHVIGEIFDRVYREGDLASPPGRGIQTTIVPAGGATAVDFRIDVPGTYLLVDHAIARTLHKGAVGAIVAEGPANENIFKAGAPATGDDGHGSSAPPAPSGIAASIPKGAWDQKNAAHAFDPMLIRTKAGSTVTWTNNDELAHTVTGDKGEFDSGFMDPRGTFSFTFTEAGTYAYHCVPHPWMKATVIVT